MRTSVTARYAFGAWEKIPLNRRFPPLTASAPVSASRAIAWICRAGTIGGPSQIRMNCGFYSGRNSCRACNGPPIYFSNRTWRATERNVGFTQDVFYVAVSGQDSGRRRNALHPSRGQRSGIWKRIYYRTQCNVETEPSYSRWPAPLFAARRIRARCGVLKRLV